MDIDFGIKFFGALFAIMNPFVTLPIFIAMTSSQSNKEQRSLAVCISCYCLAMCSLLAVLGHQIIAFFGITITDFQVAGGLVLLSIAFSMLNGKELTSHTGSGDEKGHLHSEQDIAFYPMTFPMIVGPGTITTLIIYSSQATSGRQYVAYGGVLVLVLVVMFFVLFFSSSIGKIISTKMRIIVTRVMGMILAAIAVDMVSSGLKVMLPGLAGQ